MRFLAVSERLPYISPKILPSRTFLADCGDPCEPRPRPVEPDRRPIPMEAAEGSEHRSAETFKEPNMPTADRVLPSISLVIRWPNSISAAPLAQQLMRR